MILKKHSYDREKDITIDLGEYEKAAEHLKFRLENEHHNMSPEYRALMRRDQEYINYFWVSVRRLVIWEEWTEEERERAEISYQNYLAKCKKEGFGALSKKFMILSFVGSIILENLYEVVFIDASRIINDNHKDVTNLTKGRKKEALSPDAMRMLQSEHSEEQIILLQQLAKLFEKPENQDSDKPFNKFNLALVLAIQKHKMQLKLEDMNVDFKEEKTGRSEIITVLELYHPEFCKKLGKYFTATEITEFVLKKKRDFYCYITHWIRD